jgi:hypothetical protein
VKAAARKIEIAAKDRIGVTGALRRRRPDRRPEIRKNKIVGAFGFESVNGTMPHKSLKTLAILNL